MAAIQFFIFVLISVNFVSCQNLSELLRERAENEVASYNLKEVSPKCSRYFLDIASNIDTFKYSK